MKKLAVLTTGEIEDFQPPRQKPSGLWVDILHFAERTTLQQMQEETPMDHYDYVAYHSGGFVPIDALSRIVDEGAVGDLTLLRKGRR